VKGDPIEVEAAAMRELARDAWEKSKKRRLELEHQVHLAKLTEDELLDEYQKARRWHNRTLTEQLLEVIQ